MGPNATQTDIVYSACVVGLSVLFPRLYSVCPVPVAAAWRMAMRCNGRKRVLELYEATTVAAAASCSQCVKSTKQAQ